MTVHQLVPQQSEVELETVLKHARDFDTPFEPFGPALVELCQQFSTALFQAADARRFPELQALAFWTRKAELTRLVEEFRRMEDPRIVLGPRGLVFHVPPANVDTIFVYSWFISALAGNRNIVRVSPRRSEIVEIICRVLRESLERAAPPVRSSAIVIQYGHEREITAAISAASDVRVIWGGDETVRTIRCVPLPPHAKELTFPDRYSLAALRARAFLDLAADSRADLAKRFFNDTFWFDQMACSSPRLVVWCGPADECAAAGHEFASLVEQQIADKGYAVEIGARLNKFTFACRAIVDGGVTSLKSYGSELTLLQLEKLAGLKREHCGAGLLFHFYTLDLESLAPFIERRDQTLTHFGFSAAELRRFACLLNGRGLDRMVPMGQALTFNRFWDGYDLLREMLRSVYIE
jgi:hypothetical protein